MFNVKNIKNEENTKVLDVYLDPVFGVTMFLIWENGGWRWRPASNYIPPNWKGEK